jgi:hypothetical protein
MSSPTPDIRALREVIGQMERRARDWQQELAGYLTADGDIREESLPDYEQAKDEAGWDLVETLPSWISTLNRALDAVAQRFPPRTA